MAFPFSRMAMPGKHRTRYSAQEVLELILQRGSDDEGDNTDITQHDEDSEDELFEDAQVGENSDDDETFEEADDSFDHVVGGEGAATVADHESVNEIRIFDSDSETDQAHQTGIEDRPILDSDSDDATATYDADPSQAADVDPLFHVDTDIDEPSDDENEGAWVRNVPADFPQVPDFKGTYLH